ncbi:hypothetical protein GE09DRAFT_1162101 [Coniochaeta sp. 2T2.1]|nr:hypothetical protein GE09DRAFT_1162101 [Coniochaeta sp. 2T2.1]
MFECDRCDRYFVSESARASHMWVKNQECAMCDETWPTEEDVKEHKVEEHLASSAVLARVLLATSLVQDVLRRVHLWNLLEGLPDWVEAAGQPLRCHRPPDPRLRVRPL